jgi:hypothetical protein
MGAEVKVEGRKNKRYQGKLGNGGEGRGKKNKVYDFFFYKDTWTN